MAFSTGLLAGMAIGMVLAYVLWGRDIRRRKQLVQMLAGEPVDRNTPARM